MTAINQEKNAVEVITLRDEEARVALTGAGLQAVDFFITHGDPEIKLEGTVRGGVPTVGAPSGAGCQTGFSVQAGTKRGIVTAGHCEDSQTTTAGINVGSMQSEVVLDFGGTDLQWHSDPAHLYPNEIVAAGTTVKITSAVPVSLMVPGKTQVCIVRRAGGTTCGKIYSTNYVETAGNTGPWVGVTD